MSEPDTVQGNVAGLARQRRNAVIRLAEIVQSVGLVEVDRHEAFFGRVYPAGYYAVIGLQSGHVISGHVRSDGCDFEMLFCPQSDRGYRLVELGPKVLAIRFRAVD